MRLVTWIGFAWLGYACYRPMQSVATWGEQELDLPRWGVLTAAVLIGTVPMTFAVLAVNNMDSGGWRWPSLDGLVATYFSVLVIGGGVTLLFNLVQGRSDGEADPRAQGYVKGGIAASQAGIPGAQDMWSGYPQARRRLLKAMADAGADRRTHEDVKEVVVLAAAAVEQLGDRGGVPIVLGIYRQAGGMLQCGAEVEAVPLGKARAVEAELAQPGAEVVWLGDADAGDARALALAEAGEQGVDVRDDEGERLRRGGQQTVVHPAADDLAIEIDEDALSAGIAADVDLCAHAYGLGRPPRGAKAERRGHRVLRLTPNARQHLLTPYCSSNSSISVNDLWRPKAGEHWPFLGFQCPGLFA